MVTNTTVRDAIIYMMQYRINHWWVPRQMQACMWALGAKVTEEEVCLVMEQLFQQSNALATYDKLKYPTTRYKCKAYFVPNKN